MINWRTTLGGACTATGTLLVGGPVAMTWTSVDIPSEFSRWCVMVGFSMMAAGSFWTALFARDRKVSDEQAGAGNKPPIPVEVVKPLTPPPAPPTNPV